MKESKKAVAIAFLGNLTIAVFKFIAALVSRSSSLLAEAYHSFSDTLNQVCLFIGLKRSRKKPDPQHPFGYGKEQFFWSFMVTILLFGFAGILGVLQGYKKLVHQYPLEHVGLGYAALAVALMFDGTSFFVAFREIRRFMKKEKITSVFQAIRQSKNAVILTIFFEDALAVIGIFIAATGITLTQITGKLIFDSLASITIGIMLMVFAFLLALELKNLLIGEAVTRRKRDQIIRKVEGFREVKKIIRLKTMHLSAEEVLVALEINFQDDIRVDDLEKVINRISDKIQEIIPGAKVFVEAEDK